MSMGMALFVVAILTMVTPGCGTAGQAVVPRWCSLLWNRSQRQVPAVAEALAVALAVALPVAPAGCSRERCSGGQLQHHRALEAPTVTLEAFHMQKARQLATLSPWSILWQTPLPTLAPAMKH